jgi:hypothetical protein
MPSHSTISQRPGIQDIVSSIRYTPRRLMRLKGMVHIPYDVLLRILEFLPASVLIRLINVNRTFFEAAMNARYRGITLDRESYRYFTRLQ